MADHALLTLAPEVTVKLIDSKETLQSWSEYREYLKLQLKLASGEGAFFDSKVKLEFSMDGKPWKGHAVLAAPKAELAVRQLKKEGVVFREGTCTLQGKDFVVEGIASKLLKEAAKTFLKLRLGYKVSGQDGEGGEEPDEASQGTEDLRKQAAKIAQAVTIWDKTEAAAEKEVRGLQKALLAFDDARVKPIARGLQTILERIDKVDDEAKAVQAAATSGDAAAFESARQTFKKKMDAILSYVDSDPLIKQADAFPGHSVAIAETYRKSLTQLLKAI